MTGTRFTEYEVNLLSSLENWLKTRSAAVAFNSNKHLMEEYSQGVRKILARDPEEVRLNLLDPCTLNVFHTGVCKYGKTGCDSAHNKPGVDHDSKPVN